MKKNHTNHTNFKQKEKKKLNQKKVHAKTKKKKAEMIKFLKKELGIVTAACKRAGIGRKTHYDWLDKDPKYAENVAEMPEITLDFVENALFKNIQKGVPSAQIFYLKTKGKSRNYIERQEVEHVGSGVQKFALVDIDKPEDVSKLDNPKDPTD